MEDDQVAVEPIALAFTRPPLLLGVRYEIFALNVTAVAPDRGLAEVEAKLGSLQPNAGTY